MADNMHFVYLIQSQINPSKVYVGFTSDLENRILLHNTADTGYTTKFRPWRLVYFEAYEGRNAAYKREQQLKKHGNTVVRLKKRLNL